MMRWLQLILVAGMMLCLLTSRLRAEEARTWTDSKGRTITASFVKLERGNVTLKQDNGKTVRVRVSRLSADDRAWIKKKTTNVLMDALLRNHEIGKKINALHAKHSQTKDTSKWAGIGKEIDATVDQRKEFQDEAFEVFKRYLPVDKPPFNKYKQEFYIVGAITWKLRDDENRQLGYVSLSYDIDGNSNKQLKNSGENTDRFGIPSRGGNGGMWFFLSDNVLLQITMGNDTLKKDGAYDAFMKLADIKGLYEIGGWK